MQILIDDLSGAPIADFLAAHIRDMQATSPPESKHALDLDGLRRPGISFWIVWDGQTIAGCGALKELDGEHAEIKSMRTAVAYRQKGVASLLLAHLISEARSRGYARLSLETGAMPFFAPARRLYAKFGFQPCPPFADYREDPNSVFMTRELNKGVFPMTDQTLVKLFEHNNWANEQMILACAALTDEQLDAQPQTATKGSIRETLIHLVGAQQGYLSLLTLPVDARTRVVPAFPDLPELARSSGAGLLALAQNESGRLPSTRIQTAGNYLIEPWVIMLQAINHATEHREQLNSMLTTLGLTPLELDGWSYGEATNAVTPLAA